MSADDPSKVYFPLLSIIRYAVIASVLAAFNRNTRYIPFGCTVIEFAFYIYALKTAVKESKLENWIGERQPTAPRLIDGDDFLSQVRSQRDGHPAGNTGCTIRPNCKHHESVQRQMCPEERNQSTS